MTCVGSYLDGLPGWMSVPQQFISCGLDSVHLLLPELQLPHQTLVTTTTAPHSGQTQYWNQHQTSRLCSVSVPSSCLSWPSCWCSCRSSRSSLPPPPSRSATSAPWLLPQQRRGAGPGNGDGPSKRSVRTQYMCVNIHVSTHILQSYKKNHD